MQKRYRALRAIGTIFKIFGILYGIITLLGVLGTCVVLFTSSTASASLSDQLGTPMINNVVAAAITSALILFFGGGFALTLYAMGEGAYLLMAVEENTRAAAMHMQYQSQQLQYAQQQQYYHQPPQQPYAPQQPYPQQAQYPQQQAYVPPSPPPPEQPPQPPAEESDGGEAFTFD